MAFDAEGVGRLATIAIVVLAYLLSQGDNGLQGDAHIYMGRALADLDPRGIGRDPMFAHDGQSAFSAFGLLARYAVPAYGLATTARILHLAAAVAWSAAMLTLVTVLRPGKAFAIVAAAALLLPRWYTPWHGLGAGEALAAPRPFAEAGVLLALALLARGRYLACGLVLCSAAAIHPIMAAPGFGVLLLTLMASDKRWALAALALSAALLAAGAVGAPLLDRLFVTIDPVFLSILRERSPYLFLTAWPAAAFGLIALQMVTLLVASTLVPPPVSRLLRYVVAVALLGCILSAVCCDGLHLLLFAQAQPWRSLWLAAAVAPLAAGICVWRLPDLGTPGRMALACLVAAWACSELQPIGAALAVVAMVLLGARRTDLGRASCLAVIALAGAATLLAVGLETRASLSDGLGASAALRHSMIWPLAVVGFAVFAARRPGTRTTIAALLVLPALVVALACCYDERSALKTDLDAARLKPDLVALLASRPGEVLWLGDDELWYWTGRPNWSRSLQSSGIVFSRDLALLSHDRAMALVDHGLASASYVKPWAEGVVYRPVVYDRASIDDLCRRTDAPASVVLPVKGERPPSVDANVRLWTSPLEDRWLRRDDGALVRSVTWHLIVPCRRP